MSDLKLDPSTGLTCVSCRLVFANSDIQRDHYRTDWHRYNLKRQVAALPPISQGDFETKVQLFNKSKTLVLPGNDDTDLYCINCRKLFQSKNAYDNHLNSKKHRAQLEKSEAKGGGTSMSGVNQSDLRAANVAPLIDEHMETDESENDDDSSEWRTVHSDDEDKLYDENDAISDTSCFFCNTPSSSMESNIVHMSAKHGFSIPDYQYCCDVGGLMKYIGMKIGCGRECIACNRGVKPFVDVSACQKHMRDKNHCFANVVGENILEYLDFYDYSELMAEDDGSEAIVDEGSFLTLPSGARIGHRSLFRYFRQSLKAEDNTGRSKTPAKLMNGDSLKALGWTGLQGTMSVQRARDVKYLKRVTDQYRLKQGLQSNKLFRTRGRKDQQ